MSNELIGCIIGWRTLYRTHPSAAPKAPARREASRPANKCGDEEKPGDGCPTPCGPGAAHRRPTALGANQRRLGKNVNSARNRPHGAPALSAALSWSAFGQPARDRVPKLGYPASAASARTKG